MLVAGVALASALLVLEAASRSVAWVFLRRHSAAFRFPRYGVPLFLAYVLAAGLSFGELAFHQDITPARVTLGGSTFVAGWLVRYSMMTQWWNMRVFPPGLRHAWSMRLSRVIPVRHPGYVGAVLEAAGVACVLSSPAGAVVAVLIAPSAALVSAHWKESDLVARHRAAGTQYFPPDYPAIWVPWSTAAAAMALLGLIYLFTAFLTREVEVFTSGVVTGRTLMLSMAGAQGTLGILALTLAAVLIQMTTSAYSGVLARAVWLDKRTVVALALLAASMGFDVVVVARSDSWLAADKSRAGALVDSGLLIAGVAMGFVLLNAWRSLGMLAPERVMLRVLEQLTPNRMAWAATQWPLRFGPRRLDPADPMRHVQTLLRELIFKRDLQSLRFALAQLRDRLTDYSRTTDLVSLHAYCHYYLGSLVGPAATELGADGLEEFLNLVYFVGLPAGDWIGRVKLADEDDRPSGELLLREIVDVAVAHNLKWVAGRGLRLIHEQAGGVLPLLPRQEETWRYNPDYDYSAERTEEEKHRLWDNDAKVGLVEHHYIGYFGSVAEQALVVPCDTAAWYASGDLCYLISDISATVLSPRVREMLLRRALSRLEAVARAACEFRRPEGLHIGGLHYAVEKLNSQDPKQAEAIDGIAATTARIVRRLGREGLLRYMTVVDAAMVGVYAGRKRSQAALILVQAMGQALHDMPATLGFDKNDEAQFAVKELRERIRQVAGETHGEGAGEVRKAAEELLKTEGESKDSSAPPLI